MAIVLTLAASAETADTRDLGTRLLAARERLDLSACELSRQARIDRHKISRIERGDRRIWLSDVDRLLGALQRIAHTRAARQRASELSA